jgi:peroxiredoxin Q/BCP
MRLDIGDAAPFFSRIDDTGREVTLDDYAGQSLVVYFYPKAFTPGCTAESCDFRDRHEALYAAGYEILGASPDPVERLQIFRQEHSLPFHLLSDEDHSMAGAYGAWGTKKNYGREYRGIIRSTIVIDAAGKVERSWYNVRAKGHADRVAGNLVNG